ncbi:phosphotransferase [Phreatobacter sp. HK31-P]
MAGRAAPAAIHRLAGGKNNQVFRVETADGPLLLKVYFTDAGDTRDRLGAEWSFLSRLSSLGLGRIPQPLAMVRDPHAALYSFVDGRRPLPSEIGGEAVAQAADFIIAANPIPRDLSGLAPASEACLFLRDHFDTVDRRVARLQQLDPHAPLRDEAASLVGERLGPLWARVRQGATERLEAGEAANAIAESEIIASPSDFGFHNALMDDGGRLTFIDFEYAGRDDPAKLVGDFFSCPEVPVPSCHFDSFVEALADGLGLGDAFRLRCRHLLDTYRLKWACIVLNDFLPIDAARRAFSLGGERRERCSLQLVKAAALLDQISGS